MKTFLNIIGILALLAGFLALFVANGAIQEILGAIGVLVAVTAFGSAALVERADTHLERTSAQRQLEREHWANILSANRAPTPMPAVPGAEQYFVATDGKAHGPHTLAKLSEFKAKGMIEADTMIWVEGSPSWLRFDQVFQ